MDLGAYVQIGTLSGIAEANGIKEVARLRGYRLMRDEEPVNIEEICKDREVEICEELCAMRWDPESRLLCYGGRTDPYFNKFIVNYDKKYEKGTVMSINWDVMTDEEKGILKAYIEKRNADFVKEWEMWNKYCGRNDVLYIHARQGTTNWSDTTFHDYEDKPWYLDGCNDADDSSYCDMYAKIEPFTGKLDEDESEV